MSIIVDTYTNPAWRIGAVVHHVAPGDYVVITGALHDIRHRRGDAPSFILDAFNPLASVRVFSDRDQALRHAQMVVFGEVRPVSGDVNVA